MFLLPGDFGAVFAETHQTGMRSSGAPVVTALQKRGHPAKKMSTRNTAGPFHLYLRVVVRRRPGAWLHFPTSRENLNAQIRMKRTTTGRQPFGIESPELPGILP